MDRENPEREPEKKPHKETKDSAKEKISDTFESLKKNANVDSMISYAQNNVQDTIAFALLLIGIIWSFFHNFYGELLIGLVAGFYFSREAIRIVKSFNEFIEEQGQARSIIMGGTALALFLAAPGIFIGAALMVGLKIMLKAD